MAKKVLQRTITFKYKRPDYATPELARKLRKDGMKVTEIAVAWGITRGMVYVILKQKS